MTEDKLRDHGDNRTLANVDLPVTVDIPWHILPRMFVAFAQSMTRPIQHTESISRRRGV